MEQEEFGPQMETRLREIAKHLEMTYDQLHMWGCTFKQDTKFYTVDGVPHCIYTDGDGGYMLITGDCEIFEDEGMTIQVLSQWVDLPYGLMMDIEGELLVMMESED